MCPETTTAASIGRVVVGVDVGVGRSSWHMCRFRSDLLNLVHQTIVEYAAIAT